MPRHISDLWRPEELSRDGGPPFTSLPFKQFLHNWAVRYRLSSVAYSQSNGQAELTIKSAKRIISGNTAQGGSLDNDLTARAILQYRNMPIQNIVLSPAQLLLHHRLCDFVPSQPTLYKPHVNWIATAQNRKMEFISLECLSYRVIQQNSTHPMPPSKETNSCNSMTNNLPMGHKRSSIETLPNHQYRVRVNGSGRITL